MTAAESEPQEVEEAARVVSVQDFLHKKVVPKPMELKKSGSFTKSSNMPKAKAISP